jgi:hypothetical protein
MELLDELMAAQNVVRLKEQSDRRAGSAMVPQKEAMLEEVMQKRRELTFLKRS